MPYTRNPINYPSGLVSVDTAKVNENFSILAEAFYNSNPENNPINRACYAGATPPNNPKLGQLWLDTSVNPPVLKVYDGTRWQSKVSLADNANNANQANSANQANNANYANNADMVDGFHASLIPEPNTIVPLNANGILDLSATYVKSNVYTFRRVDLTNATSDYMLQVGEEAIINFTNATSVPLRIATQSGTYYECHIICSNTGGTSGGVDSGCFLNPNNTTYSNAFVYADLSRTSTGSYSGYFTYSAFRCGFAFTNSTFYITNFTQYKNVKGFCDVYGVSTTYPALLIFSTGWRDTTTPWTSLGTIVFPQSTSGYILVRRLA